ncbi:MAG: reverse transcriptase domain-containing protein [Treponema sp.]
MKRAGKLFEKICCIQNLHEAYYKASKNKRLTAGYIDFRKNAEKNLASLRQSLLDGKYKHGKYRHFTITDPKQRLISAATFSDRVIHHAIMNVLEPVFERQFVFHTYACRKGKGTHAAARYAFKCAKKSTYFLKLDVKKYFDSIDHTILKQLLCRIIKDVRCLELLFCVIDSYKVPFCGDAASEREKGLPIGNLTSQFFANFYLSTLDHFVLEKLKPKAYVRYMDDIVIFEDSPLRLKQILKDVKVFCSEKLLLSLKMPVLGKCRNGVPFLGWKLSSKGIRILKKTQRRMKQKLFLIDAELVNGKISLEKACERAKSVYAARVC